MIETKKQKAKSKRYLALELDIFPFSDDDIVTASVSGDENVGEIPDGEGGWTPGTLN